MARSAAEHVERLERPIGALISSPLERALESAESFTHCFGLAPVIDERVIEPSNVFEGTRMRRSLLNPASWWHLRQPSLPSWGEHYTSIASRMLEAMEECWHSTESGDVVILTHQAPIWITHLRIAGLPLRHDPRTRRCALSSVTSFERVGDVWREVAYAAPAATDDAVDVGAV